MRRKTLSLAACALVALGCAGGSEPDLPTEAELDGLYGGSAEVRLNGNVVDVRVRQPLSQIRQGGELWARVGPYIYLFSPQTREIFEGYDDVAAVRVRTLAGADDPIAEAMLVRDTLTSVTWREAHRRVADARLEGTDNPGHLEDLVRFGEDYASFEYDPRYVRP